MTGETSCSDGHEAPAGAAFCGRCGSVVTGTQNAPSTAPIVTGDLPDLGGESPPSHDDRADPPQTTGWYLKVGAGGLIVLMAIALLLTVLNDGSGDESAAVVTAPAPTLPDFDQPFDLCFKDLTQAFDTTLRTSSLNGAYRKWDDDADPRFLLMSDLLVLVGAEVIPENAYDEVTERISEYCGLNAVVDGY